MLSVLDRQVGILHLFFFFPNTSKNGHEKKKEYSLSCGTGSLRKEKKDFLKIEL